MDRLAEAEKYNGWLLDRAMPFVGARVLDFGAGIGTFTAILPSTAEIVAVEPDPHFVPQLRARFAGVDAITVVEGGVEQLLHGPHRSAFDTALCFNVLEHIRDDDLALRALRDSLAPGGHLLLLVPAHPALYGAIDVSVGHERRYKREPLQRLLREAGLEPLEARYVNPIGAIGWMLASRLLRRKHVPSGPLRCYDRLVPLFRRVDRLRLPFGLSIWVVARRPGGHAVGVL